MSTTEKELWVLAPSYPGFEASTLGRVRSGTHIYANLGIYLGGSKGQIRSAWIVADAFLGPKPESHIVIRLNGDHADLSPDNLAYGTRSDAAQLLVDSGRHPWAGRDHCSAGHRYTGNNVYRRPSRPTERICRICKRQDKANARARKRLSVLLPEQAHTLTGAR